MGKIASVDMINEVTFIFIFDFLIFVPLYYHWLLKYSYMHILIQVLSKCPCKTLKVTVKNTFWGNMTLSSSFLAVWRKWKNLTIKSRVLLSLSMNIPLYLEWFDYASDEQCGILLLIRTKVGFVQCSYTCNQ